VNNLGKLDDELATRFRPDLSATPEQGHACGSAGGGNQGTIAGGPAPPTDQGGKLSHRRTRLFDGLWPQLWRLL